MSMLGGRKVYKCDNCNLFFENPRRTKTTYENYLGISELFRYYTPMIYECCPNCSSENFKILNEDNIENLIELEIVKGE